MKPNVPFFPAVLLLLATSCATAPTSVPSPATTTNDSRTNVSSPVTPGPSAPEWTSRTIAVEAGQLVFVVTGVDGAKVSDLALAAMTAYLDLPLGPNTPPVASKAITQFLGTVSETPPGDRYVKNGKSWWKVSVSKDAWDRARTELKALFDVNADPVADLERAAEELYRQGRYYDAITGYVTAAAAAVSEPARPQPARFRSSLDKAQDILRQFTLASTTPLQTTEVGKPFATTFDVRLTLGSGAQAPAIAGAPLRFSYTVKKNGRPAVTGQTVRTDAQGMVKFELPVPEFASRDSLVVLFDVNPWLEALAGTPKDLRDQVGGFETITAERKLQLPINVESASKLVPMIVALADFDERGTVLRRQETTAAVISALQKAGFQTSSIPVNPTLLKSTNDNVILAAWKFQGKTTGRAVYGTVALAGVTPSGSQFSAEVVGTLKVVDLATNKAVYQAKSTSLASAGDKASATTAAFRQWAVEAVAALEQELP